MSAGIVREPVLLSCLNSLAVVDMHDMFTCPACYLLVPVAATGLLLTVWAVARRIIKHRRKRKGRPGTVDRGRQSRRRANY